MTAEELLAEMKAVDEYAFATADAEGSPQVRVISALHFESDAIYFYTARGKNFAHELEANGKLQILALNKAKWLTIRLSCKAEPVP